MYPPDSFDPAALEYDPSAGVYRFDPPRDSDVSSAIVHAIVHVADVDPFEMEPMYHDYPLDTLDAIYEQLRNGAVELHGTIEVTIQETEVAILPDGGIRIDLPE